MFCPKCGYQVAAHYAFCQNCGQDVSTLIFRRKILVWILVSIFLIVPMLVGLLHLRRSGTPPEQKAAIQQPPSPKLSPQRAADLVETAKAQIKQKAYLAAQSTLNSVTQGTPATSPQSVEATSLLKKIGPLASRQAEQNQQADKIKQEYRNGARATLERFLLNAGYDVQVGFVTSKGATTSTNLLIVGEPVNRVFIHQLIGPGMRRSLQRDGFTKITFMKNRRNWVGEYDVVTNTIETISE